MMFLIERTMRVIGLGVRRSLESFGAAMALTVTKRAKRMAVSLRMGDSPFKLLAVTPG
jgi:hypothetical protein